MAAFARLDTRTNELREVRHFGNGAPIPMELPHKHVKWVPFEEIKPKIHTPVQIREGPTFEVLPDKVIKRWVIRDLTAAEIRHGHVSDFDNSALILRAMVLYVLNEARAVAGLAPMGMDEFRERVLDTM